MSFNLSDLFPELYPQLTPAEIAERRRTEESTPAERLAQLEAADPSQARPLRKKNIVVNHVDYLEN